MKIKNKNQEKFPGFPPIGKRGTFWMYPSIMDHYWHKLTWSEQKVIDYILRRTFGFRKTSDKISGSQFAKGVGSLDEGTGLSEEAIPAIVKKLEKKGFVKIDRAKGRTSTYHLVMSRDKGSPQERAAGTYQDKKGVTPNEVKGTINSSTKNIETIKREIVEIHSLYSKRIDPAGNARLTPTAIQNITDRLNEFTPDELKTAIIKFSSDDWCMRKNNAKGMAWFFGTEDRVESYVKMTPRSDDDER
jgi:predicted transcriptional regulator